MTPSGIEPATFQFVAQRLNHCATVVPILLLLVWVYWLYFFIYLIGCKIVFGGPCVKVG